MAISLAGIDAVAGLAFTKFFFDTGVGGNRIRFKMTASFPGTYSIAANKGVCKHRVSAFLILY